MTNSNAKLEITTSGHFTQWMDTQRLSLGFSTYQAGKLFLLGLKPDGGLSVFERNFQRCLGLWSNGQSIWMSTQFQVWRLENMLHKDEAADGFDRLYVPQVGYTTGDIDIHDIAVDADGNVVFANTLFSCIATLSDQFSFRPLWNPSFISRVAAEDRCHLNGIALENQRPKYATAVSQSDTSGGWREHRNGGGIVVDLGSNEIVCAGLSMPHSPRIHHDRLWLLNSGTGDFGYVDLQTGRFESVVFCPGYARGLAFSGKFAVIGLSKPRESTFLGLRLDDRLSERNAAAHCGLIVVDLDSGDITDWVRIDGVVNELYDIITLPGVVRPKALGFQTHEIRHSIWFSENGHNSSWRGRQKDGNEELDNLSR